MAKFATIDEYIAAIDKAINLISNGIGDAVEVAAHDMAVTIADRNIKKQENRFGGKNRPYSVSYAAFRKAHGMKNNENRSFRLSGLMWGGFDAESAGTYSAIITFGGAHAEMAEYNELRDPGFYLPSEKEIDTAKDDVIAFVIDVLKQVGIAKNKDNVL